MPSNSLTTITTSKSAFLQSQVLLLSAPVRPSLSWQTANTNDDNKDKHDGPNDDSHIDTELQSKPSSSSSSSSIPAKTLNDILTKVNAKIKSHNRLVFSIQSQRHVAEQIDALYWNEVVAVNQFENTEDDRTAGSSFLRVQGDSDNNRAIWIPRDADLSDPNIMAELPEDLDDLVGPTTTTTTTTKKPRRNERSSRRGRGQASEENDDNAHDDDNNNNNNNNNNSQKDRYRVLRAQTLAKVAKKTDLRRKIQRYRHLKTLLVPFEDVRENVQPNLVTRDGELAREVERMRVLIARVDAGLGGMKGRFEKEVEGGGGLRRRMTMMMGVLEGGEEVVGLQGRQIREQDRRQQQQQQQQRQGNESIQRQKLAAVLDLG